MRFLRGEARVATYPHGEFTGEAGPQGAVAVTGSIAHDSLRLAVVFIPDSALFPQARPDTAQFVGALTSRDRIDGTLAGDNIVRPFGLVRLAVNPP